MRKEVEWIIEFTYELNCTEVLKAVEFICRKRRLFFMGFGVSATTDACDDVDSQNLTNKTSLQLAHVSNLREFSCNLILETTPKFRLDCNRFIHRL